MFDLRLNGNEIQGNIQIQETTWIFCKNLELTGTFYRKVRCCCHILLLRCLIDISAFVKFAKFGKVKSVETPCLQILIKSEETKRARRQTEESFQIFVLLEKPLYSAVSCLISNMLCTNTIKARSYITDTHAPTDHCQCLVTTPCVMWDMARR